MDYENLQVLFHEFGHVLHSLLSRTKLQHLSGSRTKLDFMEVPSQFLEYFIHDYRYLAQFSKHYLSNAVLPSSLLSCTTRHLHILSGMEFQKQVYESILDLTIHSGNVEDLTQIAEKLHPIYMNEGSCEGLMWHAKFGHFISYGAIYYSYFYSQMYSANIWKRCFSADPLNREMGQKYRKHLLEVGGTKHPQQILKDLTGSGDLSPDDYLAECRFFDSHI